MEIEEDKRELELETVTVAAPRRGITATGQTDVVKLPPND